MYLAMAAKVVVYEPRLTPVELKVAWATCLSLSNVQQEREHHVHARLILAKVSVSHGCRRLRNTAGGGNVTIAAAAPQSGG